MKQSFYPPIRCTLESIWAKERQIEPLAVEITAAQDRRRTGGKWTRPDLVTAAVRTYRYLPGKYMEVVTFEVKPFDAIDVTAVYEALAHLRCATHAYVIVTCQTTKTNMTNRLARRSKRPVVLVAAMASG